MTADRSGPTAPPARSSAWPVRSVTAQEWRDFVRVDSHAFGSTMSDDVVEAVRETHEQSRDIGAYDGADLVGIATAYSFQLSVPGATMPAAAVSWVGVLPTHRRRGVLSALMTAQLRSVHDAGQEPIAILWASEPQIYGRFGYGRASQAYSCTVPRDNGALLPSAPADPSLRLRLVEPDDWRLTADVYATVASRRPGIPSRDERWWTRAVRDLPSTREGRSALRCVVAEDSGGSVRGYARYATKADWTGWVSAGVVSVREVMATDPAALAALYRYLFDLDLMGSTELPYVPVDDPLLHWLANPRTAKPALGDALYVRLVDLARALSGRTYTENFDVVLEVEDRTCPWNDGRWRLVGGPHGATCRPSGDPADLTLGATDLGAAFLGGTPLTELAAAGRVAEHRHGALREASRAFPHTPAPWNPAVF